MVLFDASMRSWPALSLLSAIVVFIWIRRLNIIATWRIPGPLYLKLTTVVQKYHEFNGTRTPWVHSLHLKYGTVVQTSRNEVSFATPSAAKQIYSTEHRLFNKTEFYDLFRQEGHVNLFTALNHEEHTRIKRPLAYQYSNSLVLKSKVMEIVAERANTFVTKCAALKSADIYFYLHAFGLDCTTAMLFHPYHTRSIDASEEQEKVRSMAYRNDRQVGFLILYFPVIARLFQWLRPVRFDYEKDTKDMRGWVNATIRKGDHSEFALTSRLLASDNVDMKLAESECMDHIVAGVDTTGDVLTQLFWELSQPRNEAKVTRLRKELLTHNLANPLENLPYLEAVIQEALRLWGPGTQILPRRVPAEGRSIDGYFVPGGFAVGCPSYSLHRLDLDVFPDPDTYTPERWLSAIGNKERQRSMFAFSLGPRICIGKHLALAEMRVCIHAVYSRYVTRPAEDMSVSMEMEDHLLLSRLKHMCCKVVFIPASD